MEVLSLCYISKQGSAECYENSPVCNFIKVGIKKNLTETIKNWLFWFEAEFAEVRNGNRQILRRKITGSAYKVLF